MAPNGKAESKATTTANLGFEQKLRQSADALRNNRDASEYKHAGLGLISLKYVPDAFEAKTLSCASKKDLNEYRATSIFWVPRLSERVVD